MTMKAYGKCREDCANRKVRGTSRECPCCKRTGGRRAGRDLKKKERAKAKREIQAEVPPPGSARAAERENGRRPEP